MRIDINKGQVLNKNNWDSQICKEEFNGSLELSMDNKQVKKLKGKLEKVYRQGSSRALIIIISISLLSFGAYFWMHTYLLQRSTTLLSHSNSVIRSLLRIKNYLNEIHSPIIDIMLYNKGFPINEVDKVGYEKSTMDRLGISID